MKTFKGEKVEAKLACCMMGAIYDIVTDLRPDSPTFEQWFTVKLNTENRRVSYIHEDFTYSDGCKTI